MSTKVAIVTGALPGIERGIAQELSKTHRVVGTYRGNREAAKSLRAETGEPAHIAKVTRAIADGLLDYCAGQVLQADGGFHIRTL